MTKPTNSQWEKELNKFFDETGHIGRDDAWDLVCSEQRQRLEEKLK